VINENDTVATTEIRYGDNDRLAARVAGMVGADYIIILSDIDGLYTANPDEDGKAEFVPRVSAITAEITAMAGTKRTKMGSGGMETKIEAARMSLASGNNMIISSGTTMHPIKHLMEGGRHTLFTTHSTPKSAREQWIANTFEPTGSLTIDAGAEKALHSGKSLLPAGVSGVEGTFERGDTVLICNGEGTEIARGIVAYDIADARRIMGHKSLDIENMLGYRGRDELVHRDDLVMTSQ
jgi:glutamate 5-kinase